MGNEFLALTLPPLMIAALASASSALIGNFLILSRRAMLGDAISHAVLPGIIAGFLLTGSGAGWVMALGALGAAALAVALVELLVLRGGVEQGAAMAVVFTGLFALGVLLIEQTPARGVHLDVEHALYGNLESLIWLEAEGWHSLIDPAALAGLPPEMGQLAATLAVIALGVFVFRRPLILTIFDPVFARSIGIRVGFVTAGMTAGAALASVAAFQAVGSILTIAMLIMPPATARLLTNRLGVQVALSLGLGVVASTLGILAAGYLPPALGAGFTVSAAGMIATVAGAMLGLAAIATSLGRRRAL